MYRTCRPLRKCSTLQRLRRRQNGFSWPNSRRQQEASAGSRRHQQAATAAKQPRVSTPRGLGRPYGDPNAWWKTSPESSPNEAWEFGTPGPARTRGPKAGPPASGGKGAAPAVASIYCYKCGEVGHKPNVCIQAFALEDSSGPWQPEVQQTIGWRSDWVAPEDNQNARQVWPESNWQEGAAEGTGKSGGKTGGKGKSGTKGFGGYGKSGGAPSSDKGGGKGDGWPTGGRGKGASWPGS